MGKIANLKEYKKKREEIVQLKDYFAGMLMAMHPKEKLYRAYVSEPVGGPFDWVYKLMSKLTPQGHIMYVFYEQYTDTDVDSPRYGERLKHMLHADIVYSESSFYKRVLRLKKTYGIKKFVYVNLGKSNAV